MTYAEQLLAQGLAEGEQRAKVEVVEGLLRAGVGWDVIESAAGVNASRFRALRERQDRGNGD